jgi:hypothetical protein
MGQLSSHFLSILVAAVSSYAGIASATEYELVRGSQYALCKTLVANFNEFRNEAPLTCRMKVSPRFRELSVPNWEILDPRENMALVEKAERVRFGVAEKGKKGEEFVVNELSPMIRRYLERGSLSIRRTHAPLIPGERVPLLAYSFDCEQGVGWSLDTSRVAVFDTSSSRLDSRFPSLFGADLFYWNHAPYFAVSTTIPASFGRGDPGPRKRHKGYLLIYEYMWIEPGTPGVVSAEYHGKGVSDRLVCQIGFDHIGKPK